MSARDVAIVGLAILLSGTSLGCGDDLPGSSLTITAPERGFVTTTDSVTVTGIARGSRDVARVTVNGQPARLADDGTFSLTVELQPGPQTITTEAFALGAPVIIDRRGVVSGAQTSGNVAGAISIQMGVRAIQRVAGQYSAIDVPQFQSALAAAPFLEQGVDCTADTLSVGTSTLNPTDLALFGTVDGFATELLVDAFIAQVSASYTDSGCVLQSVNVPLDGEHIHITWPLFTTLTDDGTITMLTGTGVPLIDHEVLIDDTNLDPVVASRVTTPLMDALVSRVTTLAAPMIESSFAVFAQQLTFEIREGGFFPKAITTTGTGLYIDYDVSSSEAGVSFVPTPEEPPALDNRELAVAISDDLIDQRLASTWKSRGFDPAIGSASSELLGPPVMRIRPKNGPTIELSDWMITPSGGTGPSWAIHASATLAPVVVDGKFAFAADGVEIAIQSVNGEEPPDDLAANAEEALRTAIASMAAEFGYPFASLSDDKLLLNSAPGYIIVETQPFMP